jgi:tRNA pseudouridine38-40 synthase
MRIALGIEYAGTAYAGWQRQVGVATVQGALEQALSSVAAEPVNVVCAGRTDTGVHALMQVVHFDTLAERAPRGWVLGANTELPDDIAVQWAVAVPVDFHARFGALTRSYRYLISNRRPRSALWRERVCWIREPLDHARMHRAAQALIGTHDFSAFRASGCQSSTPLRRVEQVNVRRHEDLVIVDITANAFLHHMVRNIVGTLIPIGKGEREESWAGELLTGRDRTRSGITAPAGGLYFASVRYADGLGVPPPGVQGTDSAIMPPAAVNSRQ